MKLFNNEKKMRLLVVTLGILTVCTAMLYLLFQIHIPGLAPLVSAAFWGVFWRWQLLKNPSQKALGVPFFLIIAMNIFSGISQIWLSLT